MAFEDRGSISVEGRPTISAAIDDDNSHVPHDRKISRTPKSQGRRIWLNAQRLDTSTPFGDGSAATIVAVEHLGCVQIDDQRDLAIRQAEHIAEQLRTRTL